MAQPPNVSNLQGPFVVYDMRLDEVAQYVGDVQPYIVKNPKALRVLIHGTIVLSVGYLEDFLRSLVGSAARDREAALRTYMTERTTDAAEKRRVKSYDLRELVRRAKSTLSLSKGEGTSVSKMFDALFGCSAWPSDAVRDGILDLVTVRNMIVHQGEAEVGDRGVAAYADQFRRADLFKIRHYGEFSIHEIDAMKALLFYAEVLPDLQAQIKYLRDRLVRPHMAPL